MIAIAATIAVALVLGVAAERCWSAQARAAARVTLLVMLYALVPVVAFLNVAHLHITVAVGLGIVLGHLALVGAGALAWLVGQRVLRLARPATGALICSVIQGNTGYLGYPLCVALLGASRLPEAVAYDQLVQGPVLFLLGFGAGAAFGVRAGERPALRLRAFILRNPPLAAVVAGLLAPAALAPRSLVELSHGLVDALLPLGFFAVGVTLAAEWRRRGVAADRTPGSPPPAPDSARGLAALTAAVALRLVAAPAILALAALPLIHLPTPYLLLAAMPTGINSLVIAHAYGLDLRLTSAAIATSTALVVTAGLGAVVVG